MVRLFELNKFATKDSYKLLGTSHVIGKVMQSETSNLSESDHYWFKRRSREKTPVTREKKIIVRIIILYIFLAQVHISKCCDC